MVPGCKRRACGAVPGMCLAVALMSAGTGAGAASANGVASATIVSQLISLPIVIRFSVAPSGSYVATPEVSGPDKGDQLPESVEESWKSLIQMDAAGTATFSIAGSVTSNYTLQTLGAGSGFAALDSSGDERPRPEGPASGLILPAPALTEGDGLSFVISQSLTSALGELRVLVQYN